MAETWHCAGRVDLSERVDAGLDNDNVCDISAKLQGNDLEDHIQVFLVLQYMQLWKIMTLLITNSPMLIKVEKHAYNVSF